MDRLLEIYAQQRTHPTTAETCRNIILDILKSGKEDTVRWKNPNELEFEIIKEAEINTRLYIRTGKNFKSLLNEGMKFFRKVPGYENVYRFHFLPKHLLPIIPRKTLAQTLRLPKETSV